MGKEKLKIIFLGTPKFGAIILEELVKNNYKPVLVITTPDKPVGRKQILTPPPVKLVAQKYNIPVSQPEIIANLKSEILNLKSDLIVVAAYGQIIPKDILKTPRYGCLNIHPSLLPKYRGPSPIQATILNNDQQTGVTIILMDEKIDHGPILANSKFQIPNSKITYQELNRKLANLGVKLLIKTIPKWIKGKIKPKIQNELKASYTKILKREDGKIDWSKPAKEIERQIRAFHPWPGSFTFCKRGNKTFRVKILEADVSKTENPQGLSVKCGRDYLVIKKLQPEGKKPMTAEEFLRGYHGCDFLS